MYIFIFHVKVLRTWPAEIYPYKGVEGLSIWYHQTMNVLGGVASVTQLAAYSHVVARRLIQLHQAAQEGPSFCKAQRFNISFLLVSIQRIGVGENPNTDSLLPLLIATANLATSLLKLLVPKGTFYNDLLWTSKGQEIESAFRALNDKTRLLQLHISERTYNLIRAVQQDIETMHQGAETCSSQDADSVCIDFLIQE